ncbi:MAG: hypothetical protein C5B51_10055 [Terriglobia bacterium]|nr:MAG: hypothetical protein C5B51_10055 [Terriglobia bacterium]
MPWRAGSCTMPMTAPNPPEAWPQTLHEHRRTTGSRIRLLFIFPHHSNRTTRRLIVRSTRNRNGYNGFENASSQILIASLGEGQARRETGCAPLSSIRSSIGGFEPEVKKDFYKVSVWSCLVACLALGPLPAHAAAPVYTILTVAGNATKGYSGDGGPASQAAFSNPCKVAVDGSANIFVSDQINSRIRQVSAGNVNTVAGNGTAGYSGDGKTPSQASISQPCGLAIDSSGSVYFSQTDSTNSAVRKAPSNGNMSTVAGTSLGAGFSGDGAAATKAQVNAPVALALDAAGNLYVADTLNHRIRMVGKDGNINTVAGNGFAQFSGEGGVATQASLNSPQGIAVDAKGNLYIADTLNQRIRMVSGGVITTIAGNGTAGFSGDNGLAVKAQLNYPKDVAVDAAGNLYIADSYNFRIRMVTPDGAITTIAGRSASGYAGDGGLATNARLNFPQGVAVGPNGTIYIADTQNNVIRLLTPLTDGSGFPPPTSNPPLITSVVSASACGAFSSAAPGSWIEIRGTNLATTARAWTGSDFQGNLAPTSLEGTRVTIAGQSAVVLYISPNQVNAQVPVTVSPGTQQVSVTSGNLPGAAYSLTINAAQPGLCQGVQIAGTPYLAAVVSNTATYILPANASIPGVTSRPARAGEVITFFGNGFGAVTPGASQGQIVSQLNQLTTPLQIFFGQAQATVQYQGLAPGFLGLYQFNVVVPNIPDSDAVPVTFALGNFAGAPTLYTAVRGQ